MAPANSSAQIEFEWKARVRSFAPWRMISWIIATGTRVLTKPPIPIVIASRRYRLTAAFRLTRLSTSAFDLLTAIFLAVWGAGPHHSNACLVLSPYLTPLIRKPLWDLESIFFACLPVAV